METAKKEQTAADKALIGRKERELGETLSKFNRISTDWTFNTDESKDAWYADTVKNLAKKRDRLEIELCKLKDIEERYY